MKKGIRALLAALLILVAGALPARAVTLGGRASTQAYWFADEEGKSHFDLAQYARLNVRQIDAANTVSLTGYGRAWGDFVQGGGVDGRLYYLYLDKKELVKKTDVRVGRQFFFISAGSAIVDGARVDVRALGPVTLTVAGGRNVLFDTTGEETTRGDMAAGVQLSLTGIPQLSADVSFLITYDESERAKEIGGLSANKRFGKYGEIYTQLRYDFLSEVWNEVQVGARTAVLSKTTITAEYFETIPVFSSTDIFSVFAVEHYQESLLRAQYDLNPKVSLFGEYRHEGYGDDDAANVGELGTRFRPSDGMSVYAAGIWRSGTGGNLVGFELSGDQAICNTYLVGAGVQYDKFRNEEAQEYETATKVWIGGNAKLRKNLSAQARVEDTVSDRFDKDIRARLALNYDF